MGNKVLLAFASTYGSTREVAEAIAETLREGGSSVDLCPAREVRSLESYTAVVLGAPLYMFHWHKDALSFLVRHRAALQERPVAIFAGGPIGAGDEKEWQGARQQLDTELGKYPWLQPAAVEIVGGKFDPDHLRFPWNLIPYMRQQPANDLRDWAAIRAWAGSLVERFEAVQSQSGSGE